MKRRRFRFMAGILSTILLLSGCSLFKPSTEIKINPEHIEMSLGQEPTLLTYTITTTKKDLNQDVKWSSDNSTVATVSDGYVTPVGIGTTNIWATLVADSSVRSSCSVTVVKAESTQIEIDPSSVVINLSNTVKTAQLSCNFTDTGEKANVTWSSSTAAVVTVSSTGKLTGKTVGKAEITATLKEDSAISAKCQVEVINSRGIVESIVVSPKTLSLDVYNNKTGNLSATVVGDSELVTWSSSNRQIATVSSSGKVTALKKGTATITATSSLDSSFKDTCTVNVTDSTPISVSLNESAVSVKQGKTFQLTATVNHYNTSSEVTWSGGENGISVSSTGLVSVSETATIEATATIVATSVEDTTKSASCVITVVENTGDDYDYTIMLYMCASTLEHDSKSRPSEVGLFSTDIIEILSVKNIPDSVKIIIETGGTKKWYFPAAALDGTTSILNTKLQRWEVEPVSKSYTVTDPAFGESVTCYNKLKAVETLDTNQMASTTSFQSFLEWGLEDYSATQMGVIISGHGGGVDGCAYDDNYDKNSLSTSEVALAAKNALKTSTKSKFTWIGYDACIMGVADVASVNADYFEYMVASQELENGTGWNHDVYLKNLVANPNIVPKDFLPTIVSAFLDENCGSACPEYYQGESYDCAQTLSVLDLSKMGTFVDEFNSFVETNGYSQSAFNTYKSKFNSCEMEFGENCYGLVDAREFLKKFNATAVLNVLNDMVIANEFCENAYDSGVSGPCGLNIFFAYSSDREYGMQVIKSNYTSNDTKFTNWQTMNYNYGSYASSGY